MKVTRLTFKNALGIEELEIKPGQVTRIHGQNGLGKTSIKRSLAAVIEGGRQRDIRRIGTDQTEIGIETDGGISITRTMSDGKSDTKVTMGEGIKLATPMNYIKQLFGTSFNPVSFLELNSKSRLDEVLQRIPMTVTREQVEFIAGQPLAGIDFNQHGLKVLNQVHTAIYDTRKQVNANAKAAKSQIEQLTPTLIPEPDMSKDGILTAQINQIEMQLQTLAVENDHSGSIQKTRDERLAKAKADYEALCDTIYRETAEALSENARKFAEMTADLNAQMATLDNQGKELQKAKQMYNNQAPVRAMIEQAKVVLATNETKSEKYSAALKDIEQLKAEKIAGLEIGGMKINIVDDELVLDGIPWDDVNTAKRILFAMHLCAEQLGECRFAVIDGAEALDSKHQELMAKIATDMDIQLIMLAADDNETLTIEDMSEVV